MAKVKQSDKLKNVLYDIRGPVLEQAEKMEAAGQRILRLNIGNPAPFGFEAPDAILVDMIKNLPRTRRATRTPAASTPRAPRWCSTTRRAGS